jgi:hypothetical protein
MYRDLIKYLQHRNFTRVHHRGLAPLAIDTLTAVQAQELCESLCSAASPENVTCDGEASAAQVRASMRLYRGAAADLQVMFPQVRPQWDDADLFA